MASRPNDGGAIVENGAVEVDPWSGQGVRQNQLTFRVVEDDCDFQGQRLSVRLLSDPIPEKRHDA